MKRFKETIDILSFKYLIIDENNNIICLSPTLKIAKKELKEIIKTDQTLQKKYKWNYTPCYSIIKSEEF